MTVIVPTDTELDLFTIAPNEIVTSGTSLTVTPADSAAVISNIAVSNTRLQVAADGDVIADGFSYIRSRVTIGSGVGEGDDIRGACQDSDGNFYVTEIDSNKVMKFDSDWNILVETDDAGGTYPDYSQPLGVAVMNLMGGRYILVCDYDNDRIVVLDEDLGYITEFGSFGTGIGELNGPRDIVFVEPESCIYIIESSNHRISRYDVIGDSWSVFGSYGTGNSNFDSPQGISYINNILFVADTNNLRVMQITPGVSMAYFGKFSTFDGGKPIQVCQKTDTGYLYVLIGYTSTAYFEYFDPAFTYVSTYGDTGVGEAPLIYPLNMFLGSDDRLYIAQTSNSVTGLIREWSTEDINPELTLVLDTEDLTDEEFTAFSETISISSSTSGVSSIVIPVYFTFSDFGLPIVNFQERAESRIPTQYRGE